MLLVLESVSGSPARSRGWPRWPLCVLSNIILWNCSTISSQWSGWTVFHQNSFPSYFLLEKADFMVWDALWEDINAIKANSRSQTSAWPLCLLPSWLLSGTAGPLHCSQQPIWFFFTPSLFCLYCIFPPTFSSLYFISNLVTALKDPLLPMITSGVKSKCKSLNENNSYYNLNEF